MTRVTIVRHGETEWNVSMQLQGHRDSPLTPLGVAQVDATAKLLKERDFDVFISSDLKRAADSALILNRYHNMDIIANSAIRERSFGIMEGLTRDELKRSYPDIYEGYMQRIPDYQIPNGESLEQFYHRVIDEINNLAMAYFGKNLLIVAHGGVLDCVIRKVFDMPLDAPRRFRLYNASINTILVKSDNIWLLEEWGVVSKDSSLAPRDELATLEVK